MSRTQPTHDETFAAVLLAVAIPTFVGSFILVGNIAYISSSRPHAIRIVLLIGNGVMLLAQITASPARVFLLAKDVEWPFDATAWAGLRLMYAVTTHDGAKTNVKELVPFVHTATRFRRPVPMADVHQVLPNGGVSGPFDWRSSPRGRPLLRDQETRKFS